MLPKLLMFSTESLLAFGSQLHVESVSWKHSHCGYAAKPVKFLSAMLMPSLFQSWNGHESCSRVMQGPLPPSLRVTGCLSAQAQWDAAWKDRFLISKVATSSMKPMNGGYWGMPIFKFTNIICRAPKYVNHHSPILSHPSLQFHLNRGGGPLLDTAGKEAQPATDMS